jgi:carboxypeptidase T
MNLLLRTAFLLALATSAGAAEHRSIVRIKDGDAAYRQALGHHFGHLPRDRKQGDIVLDVGDEDWRWLQRQGYAPRFDSTLTAQYQRAMAKSFGDGGCYSTVEETDAFIDAQVAAHPTLAAAFDIGDSWEKTSPGGNAGYDLRLLRITNAAITEDKPKMFVMSGLHAREYTPVQLNLKFAEWLLSNYGSSAEATWLVDHNEFHLLLQANPDGRKEAELGEWQRKNRHVYGSCTGTGIGVDLNRNFPFFWNQVPGGSSGTYCATDYRGPNAVSEPETQAVNDYVTLLFPDTRGGSESSLVEAASIDTRGAYFDLHSYSQIVMHPWGVTDSASGNDAAFKAIARRMAWFNDYSPEPAAQLYATDGASDDNAYGRLGVPAFTIELGTTFFESCVDFNSTILPDNLETLKYAARVLHRPYLMPAGPDAYGASANPASVVAGVPVTVTASASDARFNHSNGNEPMQNVTAAFASVDRLPWDPLAVALPMSAADGAFNASTENLVAQIATSGWTPGRHIVFVQASDASGAAGAIMATFVDIDGAPVLFANGFE